MITDTTFRQIIKRYKSDCDNLCYDTLHTYLCGLQLEDEFHTCNLSKVKGDIFEYLCKYYYLSKNKEVYLYSEIPYSLKQELNLPNIDKGIDLIYKFNDIWIGVQCKWRTQLNQAIDKNLVAGFITELNRTKLDHGVLCTNVKQITKYFIDDNIKWITYTGLSNIINNDFIDFIVNHTTNTTYVNEPQKINNLRYYQKEALVKLRNSNERNKQCIMFCGTGKSITMIDYIRLKKAKKVVILMPSLHLVSQFYKNINANYHKQNILCICSQMDKESLTCGEENNSEEADQILKEFIALDTDVKYTTTQTIINKKLDDEKLIVLCTYQSSYLLENKQFDLGIFDEAHKTVNSDTFGFCLKDDKCKINERIYFTATPRYYKGKEETCISMNNKEIYGEEIYSYNYHKAREDKYVLDFQIIAYVVQPCLEEIVNEKYIKKDNLKIKSEILISAIQLAQHIKNTNSCKKILTYHNSINNAIEYKKSLNYVFEKYGIVASIFHMSGKTHMNQRQQIFNEFEKANIGIICSSKVLNEGVDIPCVDCVMFVDQRSSTIDVTQCVGRGMRLYKDQKVCNIIIPIHYNQLEEEHNYSQIIRILTAMNEIDSKLIEYFVTKNVNNKIIVKNMDVVDMVDNYEIKYNLDEIISGLNTQIVKSIRLGFEYNKALLFEYCDLNKSVPTRKEKYKNQLIGSWLQHQKKKIANKNDDLYIKLSGNQYVKQSLDKYLEKKQSIK